MKQASQRCPAVVLASAGCMESALNVTRALGEKGVRVIVISEQADTVAARSRYCSEFHHVAPFAQQVDALGALLCRLGESAQAVTPVFPTGDPDLRALMRLEGRLGHFAQSTLGPARLVQQLIDKQAFAELALQQNLPVPWTRRPSNQADLCEIATTAPFPLVIKPVFPFDWSPSVASLFHRKKALAAHNAPDLIAACETLRDEPLGVLVQSQVVGDDPEHYDVHAYIAASPKGDAVFVGRKWRIFPIHAGSGTHVESVRAPALEASTLQMLRQIGFRGIANVNYKRDARTGEFKLLEINARVSQWNIFTTRVGINLPWLAYCEACGIDPGPRASGEVGRHFIDGKNDFKAFLAYRRIGELGWGAYLRSLLRPGTVHQVFCWHDLVPWLSILRRTLRAALQRVTNRG